jgi:hypothetical protein
VHSRVRLVRFLRLGCRIAETIERNKAFTVFDDLKMAAMSGCVDLDLNPSIIGAQQASGR